MLTTLYRGSMISIYTRTYLHMYIYIHKHMTSTGSTQGVVNSCDANYQFLPAPPQRRTSSHGHSTIACVPRSSRPPVCFGPSQSTCKKWWYQSTIMWQRNNKKGQGTTWPNQQSLPFNRTKYCFLRYYIVTFVAPQHESVPKRITHVCWSSPKQSGSQLRLVAVGLW